LPCKGRKTGISFSCQKEGMMNDFSELIEEEVSGYTGRHENIVSEAPSFYRLLTRLLDDPDLTLRLRPLVLTSIGYFAIPGDIIPEDLQGPLGFLDDIFLVVLVADTIRKELKSEEILTRNWDGNTSLSLLIDEFKNNEEDLIGDKRDQILKFVGYEFLKK
jgi:uncharacterized membrane protein YkvA (DUF1232 family)